MNYELFAKLNFIEIVTAHKTLSSIYKSKLKIEKLPDSFFPKNIKRNQLIAYQAFADAVAHLQRLGIDYVKLKKLIAYVSGDVWQFRYLIKEGFFRKGYYEFIWKDGDTEEYDEEKEKLKKCKGCKCPTCRLKFVKEVGYGCSYCKFCDGVMKECQMYVMEVKTK